MTTAKFNQDGYRVCTDLFSWDSGTTCADVVLFERDELGNDNGVDDALIPLLAEFPARGHMMWVAGSFQAALRYTIDDWDEGVCHPDRVEVMKVSDWFVIGCDGDDGYLVVHPRVLLDKNSLPWYN